MSDLTEQLARTIARAHEDGCDCPYGIRGLGRLYGVNMGPGIVRLSTAKGCPLHDAVDEFRFRRLKSHVARRHGRP